MFLHISEEDWLQIILGPLHFNVQFCLVISRRVNAGARWAGQARRVRGDQNCDQVHQFLVDWRPPNNPTSPFQGCQINH